MKRAPVAVVTGASSGFGLLTSITLADLGFRVFATMRAIGRRDELDEAASRAGVDVDVVSLDVTDDRSVREAVARIEAAAGGIDVLVNNAGIAVAGLFEDLDVLELREQLETNVIGIVRTTQAVLPGMRARRSGRIINVSSAGGKLPTPMLSGYCGTKAAVDALSEALRIETKPFGISVSVVAPGTFKTAIFAQNRRVARRASDPESPFFDRNQRLERGVARMLAQNHANPQDVADAVVRAATDRRPSRYYRVGIDAHMGAIARALMPEAMYEWGLSRYFESLAR
ncbi:MAG: SDR family oxidoreductase [Deltaproteobacteria bacterium]|nr:SDR family oxidoreductase [Deltaproteobacteria bacterium]